MGPPVPVETVVLVVPAVVVVDVPPPEPLVAELPLDVVVVVAEDPPPVPGVPGAVFGPLPHANARATVNKPSRRT
jgi:hypothetical protein